MAERALLILLGTLLSSCQQVRIVTRAEGAVLRDWDDCAQLIGDQTGISVAGMVRTVDGEPLDGAFVFLDDVAPTKTELGKWRPLAVADSPEGIKRTDRRGVFVFASDRLERIHGVALLGVMAHGYEPGSLGWSTSQKACVEFILNKQPR